MAPSEPFAASLAGSATTQLESGLFFVSTSADRLEEVEELRQPRELT